MKLEAGKTYRMRNGQLETLEQMRYGHLRGIKWRWFYDGTYNDGQLVFGGRPQHPCDLMEEVEVTSQNQ